jgi:hypothetical protein
LYYCFLYYLFYIWFQTFFCFCYFRHRLMTKFPINLLLENTLEYISHWNKIVSSSFRTRLMGSIVICFFCFFLPSENHDLSFIPFISNIYCHDLSMCVGGYKKNIYIMGVLQRKSYIYT